MTNATTHTRRLAPGTLVIAVADGEPGRILEVCTFRRNGLDAYSYVVATAARSGTPTRWSFPRPTRSESRNAHQRRPT